MRTETIESRHEPGYDAKVRIEATGPVTTKNQLRARIPQVRFSGKNKTVYVDGNLLNYTQIEIIKGFCRDTGYKSILN